MPTHLVTTAEAARILGVTPHFLSRWAHQGRLTPAAPTPDGHLRWDLIDLKRQLDIFVTTITTDLL